MRVAEANSFIKAAQQLGVTRSVISHRVQQLEAFINAPLFHRSTRHVRLSEVGQDYYKECSETVAHLHSLTERMRDSHTGPSGKLRIQVLPGFAAQFSILLSEFTELYPDLEMDVVVNDKVADPIEDGLDVALQIFSPMAETLIERKLFSVRRLFCASPVYLARNGFPVHPSDLLHHRIMLYEGYPTRNKWAFKRGNEELEISLFGHVRSTSVHLLRDCARMGSGIACLPTLVATEDLVAGNLVPVLTDYTLSSFNLSAVYPATHRRALKVQRLLDFLVNRITDEPAWDRPLIQRGWLAADT
ncbi:D-malate degradation protein R [Pseudomonas sp. 58 R 3]|nr:D-malate degradation protein R [Pseudomonas sp. 58 R 3]